MTVEEIKLLFNVGTVCNNSNLLGRDVRNFTITEDAKFYESTLLERGINTNTINVRLNGGASTWTLYRFDNGAIANRISGYNVKSLETSNYEIF